MLYLRRIYSSPSSEGIVTVIGWRLRPGQVMTQAENLVLDVPRILGTGTAIGGDVKEITEQELREGVIW